jgi:hypothetical protein
VSQLKVSQGFQVSEKMTMRKMNLVVLVNLEDLEIETIMMMIRDLLVVAETMAEITEMVVAVVTEKKDGEIDLMETIVIVMAEDGLIEIEMEKHLVIVVDIKKISVTKMTLLEVDIKEKILVSIEITKKVGNMEIETEIAVKEEVLEAVVVEVGMANEIKIKKMVRVVVVVVLVLKVSGEERIMREVAFKGVKKVRVALKKEIMVVMIHSVNQEEDEVEMKMLTRTKKKEKDIYHKK